MKSKFSNAAFVVLAATVFLAVNHRAWLFRKVVVNVELKTPVPVDCRLFYTEEANAEFVREKSVTFTALPCGTPVETSFPADRLERIRFDFGTRPVKVRASRMIVRGTETRVLDWRDFGIRHDIGRFDVDARGAVTVEAVGGAPHAARTEPLGIPGRLCVNVFAAAAHVGLAALVWWMLLVLSGELRRFAGAGKKRFRTATLLLLAVLLAGARLWFTTRIPPWFGPSLWDDHWFVKAADSLLRGEWLGTYDQYALCKGCAGPMVLSLSAMLGISFPAMESLLYVLGCGFFVIVLSRIVRNGPFLLAVFGALLFNPLSFSFLTMQRVYRNGMAAWQVPIVFGCLFMAYRQARKKEPGTVSWQLISGFSLWAFLNTREDGVWIGPFVFACLAFAFGGALKAGTTRREKAFRALSCLLPLLVVACGNGLLCLANQHVYGLPIRNDRDAGHYAEAMRDLYLIEPDPADEKRLSSPEHTGHYHNIYYSTLCKAYDESPTLRGARPQIDAVIDSWARFQGYSGRDLKFDHMLFAIRDGVARNGVYLSLPASEAFFGNVHRELSEAFAAGRLSRRGVSFTAMAAPFRSEFVPDVFRAWGAALTSVVSFQGIGARMMDSEEPGKMVAGNDVRVIFERTTRCRADMTREERDAARSAVDAANAAADAYSAVVPWAALSALFAYAVLTVLLAFRRFRTGTLPDGWLLATGLLASMLVHAGCIAYVSATTVPATTYHYMAASYQMALLFIVIVAGVCLETVQGFVRRTVRKRESE